MLFPEGRELDYRMRFFPAEPIIGEYGLQKVNGLQN